MTAETKSVISEREIKVAAAWWAEAVMCPKHDALGKTRDAVMEFSQVLADLNSKPVLMTQSSEFESHLRAELRIAVVGREWYVLGVDYDPDKILADCGRASGITDFPWKTIMWLKPGSVAVRHGYGAEIQELLSDG